MFPPARPAALLLLLTLLLLCQGLLASGALCQNTSPGQEQPPSTPEFGDTVAAAPYTADFRIEAPDTPAMAELRELLTSVSDAVKSKDRPPPSRYLLTRRVEDDVPNLMAALKSRGFYGAEIEPTIGDGSPAPVVYVVRPGAPYPLTAVDIATTDPAGPPPPDAVAIGLVVGQPALAEVIAASEDKLLEHFRDRGRPFPSLAKSLVLVDHADRSVRVEYTVDPGAEAFFGETEFSGQETVKEEFLHHKLPWKAGDQYKGHLLTDLQTQLIKTGLFSLVQVKTDDTVGPDGRLPVRVSLTERKHRTVKAGVSYHSDIGAGVQTSWEHRNLFGGGEDLELTTRVATNTVSAAAKYRVPEFLREDQVLLASVRVARDSVEAYTSRNVVSAVLVDRNLTPRIVVGAGLGFDAAQVDEAAGEETEYILLSVPAHIDWNNKNDLLNPTAGEAASLQVQPYWDVIASEYAFTRLQVALAKYLQIISDPSVVLAGRMTVGSLTGSSTAMIPADKRYYAGGGGSVRGYPYQTVGPLDDDDNPEGGRSLFEVSGEVRYRVTEKFGLVAFLDGGNAYQTVTPKPSDLLWGTGLGFRYFTPIGPLRLDVGIPLNRRQGIDDPFQIYVSLGQAF